MQAPTGGFVEGIEMGWQEAQALLTWISFALGMAGFCGSLLWHHRHDTTHCYDWAERLARSAFVYLQCAMWGTVLSFVVMANIFGVDFGGVK